MSKSLQKRLDNCFISIWVMLESGIINWTLIIKNKQCRRIVNVDSLSQRISTTNQHLEPSDIIHGSNHLHFFIPFSL